MILIVMLAAARVRAGDKPSFAPPASVALLPVLNQSKTEQAAEEARLAFQQALEEKGYQVQPEGRTDELLNEKFGAADAVQIQALEPAKIGEALGVEALVYGTVVTYKSQNIGVYRSDEVELSFRMINAKSGERLWENKKSAWDKNLETSLKSAAASAAAGVVRKFVPASSAALTEKAVRWCIATLPRGPHSKAEGTTTQSTSYSHTETTETEETEE